MTDTFLKPGLVDFTPAGYMLFREIIVERFGEEHVRFKDSGWRIDYGRREVHLLAETEELCRRRLDELMGKPSLFIADGAEITRVAGPEAIGPWRPNRFIVIPTGFYAKAEYILSETRETGL